MSQTLAFGASVKDLITEASVEVHVEDKPMSPSATIIGGVFGDTPDQTAEHRPPARSPRHGIAEVRSTPLMPVVVWSVTSELSAIGFATMNAGS